MNPPTVLSIGQWAHHSWLVSAQKPRTERAHAAANALLLARYRQLTGLDFTHGVPLLMQLPRPACARVLRVAAALACARTLRRVVSTASRSAFAASIAPDVLTGIQQHVRGYLDDVRMGAGPDIFNRRDMTAAGLALSLPMLADAPQRMWLRLRMPREVAETAARFRVDGIPQDAAHRLIADAWKLMRGEPC